jgi:hypothetical protein
MLDASENLHFGPNLYEDLQQCMLGLSLPALIAGCLNIEKLRQYLEVQGRCRLKSVILIGSQWISCNLAICLICIRTFSNWVRTVKVFK